MGTLKSIGKTDLTVTNEVLMVNKWKLVKSIDNHDVNDAQIKMKDLYEKFEVMMKDKDVTVLDIFSRTYKEWNEIFKKDVNDHHVCFTRDFADKALAFLYNQCDSLYQSRFLADYSSLSFTNYLTDKQNEDKIRNDFIQDCGNANTDERFASKLYEDMIRQHLKNHLMDELGVTILDKLSKKFNSKSDILRKMLAEFLDVTPKTTKDVASFSLDFRQYLETWINDRSKQEVDKFLPKHLTDRLDRKVRDIELIVKNLLDMEHSSATEWYKKFKAKLEIEETTKDLEDRIKEVTDFKTVSSNILENLQSIRDSKDSYMNFVSVKSHFMKKTTLFESIKSYFMEKTTLFESIKFEDMDPIAEVISMKVGCTNRCILCGASCDSIILCDGEGVNRRHETCIHRPKGLSGFHYEDSKKLVYDICTTSVASNGQYRHPSYFKDDKYRDFKDFNTDVPEWRIKADADSEAQDYWKYIFAKHQADIAKMKNLKPADYPKEWDTITLEMAKANIENMIFS